jgi:nitrogen fixation protein FixH
VSGRIWAWVPALLLTGLLGTQMAILYGALDDASFAIEPDYYRKALAWDEQQKLARSSRALGWHAELMVAPGSDVPGLRTRVRLTDSAGEPVGGADFALRAVHNARAAQPFESRSTETEPGVYEATVPNTRAGLWEFTLTAARGAETFRDVVRREVGRDEAPR